MAQRKYKIRGAQPPVEVSRIDDNGKLIENQDIPSNYIGDSNYIRSSAYVNLNDTIANPDRGDGSNYKGVLNPQPESLPDGFQITLITHIPNSNPCNLKLNTGGGEVTLALKDDNGAALPAGKLKANKAYEFIKIGAENSLYLKTALSSNITISSSDPTPGSGIDGDIWLKYT